MSVFFIFSMAQGNDTLNIPMFFGEKKRVANGRQGEHAKVTEKENVKTRIN